MITHHSELDSRRFSRRIHRALVEDVADAEQAVAACRRGDVDMLIARCPVASIAAAHALEQAGFRLMDTLVYYVAPTARFVTSPSIHGVELRPFQAADLAALEAVAREAFGANYGGHYHADPQLDRTAATAGYVEWFTYATQDPALYVLSAVLDGRAVGFLTLRWGRGDDPADIELNAVAPAVQGRGIYDGLVKAAGLAAREHGDARITVSTHLGNFAPQKVWVRNGFEPFRACYTFHGWMR